MGRLTPEQIRQRKVLLLVIGGAVLCIFGLLANHAYRANQADFRAHAVQARGVIDQLDPTYADTISMNRGRYNPYGMVRFSAKSQTAHARVLLQYCSAGCRVPYRVGQVITVYYSPENLGYAQLSPNDPGTGVQGIPFAIAAAGLISIAIGVISLFRARRERQAISHRARRTAIRSGG